MSHRWLAHLSEIATAGMQIILSRIIFSILSLQLMKGSRYD